MGNRLDYYKNGGIAASSRLASGLLAMTQGEDYNLERFKRRGFELCLAIYRVTKLFPSGEVLSNQLRRSSSQIIVLLAAGKICDTILKVEEVKIYLAIARQQNWVKPINFDLLETGYSLLADGLSVVLSEQKAAPEKKAIITPPPAEKKESGQNLVFRGEEAAVRLSENSEADGRQKQIIDYFDKNGQAKVSDLVLILGKVSERTVRNDIGGLIRNGFIKKVGSRKNARYLLNSQ